ncbi:MAG: sulfatase-like hydrolase/transferase [Anaerolineaceae bacterium]|nr:sulfatase-like hydrolase/transferase [Anaerolineaceae bacterium]
MKRTRKIALGFIFLAAICFSLLVLIKPGASYFYKKSQIQSKDITRAGNAYQYLFNVDTQIYDPNTALVLEDQKPLDLTALAYSEAGGKGSFAVQEITAQQIVMVFVPSNPADAAANGHTFNIYIRPYVISGTFAWIILGLALLGWITFLWPGLADQGRRQGLVQFLQIAAVRARSFKMPSRLVVIQSASNIILAAFLYVFMEWLFFVTSPSFMSAFDFGEKIKIMLISGFAAAVVGLLTLPVMFVLDLLITPFFPAFRKYIYHLPAAIVMACLCLILIDNFTYTVFKFGIVDTTTILRGLYALGFIGLLVYLLRQMTAAAKPRLQRVNVSAALGLFILSGILAVLTFQPRNSAAAQAGQNVHLNSRPNILLLGTDGLNAKSMSVYGYSRDTTPFISELAKSSLVSENNFTNAFVSEGSDTATLTGKLAFATHVLNVPDTLQGGAQYQSLPRLLKMNGYHSVSLGTPLYVDMNAVNMKDAFDAVNCQSNPTDSPLAAYNYDNEIYMLTTIQSRIGDRLKHIFFIQEMLNPYKMVTQANSGTSTDKQRIDCLHAYLKLSSQTGQPLFAHIHLMGTHGFTFSPPNPVFSKGEKQDKAWMTDFYDDTILNFDGQVQDLVQYLKAHHQWDNTILILYTDHGEKWTTKYRIPLIVHFPNDAHAGTITADTQNIDIAPTLLDYLGIPAPAWMSGSSILRKLDPNRLIVAGYNSNQTEDNFNFNSLKPPYYQFAQVSVIQCQNWFIFDLKDKSVSTGLVQGYVNPCEASSLDAQEAVRGKVSKVLKGLGYTLPDW